MFQYVVPSDDTTYSCRIFDLSNLGRKHHMVKLMSCLLKRTVLNLNCIYFYCGFRTFFIIDCSLKFWLRNAMKYWFITYWFTIDLSNYICYHDPDLSKRPCGHMVAVAARYWLFLSMIEFVMLCDRSIVLLCKLFKPSNHPQI